MPSQAAVDAHERTTGPELWRQASGTIDVFLDFVGTASTFTGVMRYHRRQNANIRGYVVEPATAPIVAGRSIVNTAHAIQGAIDLLKGHERGATSAFLICDSGLKYLSTGLYQ